MDDTPTHLGVFHKIEEAISIRKYNESIENERVKSYLISLNYLSVEIIQLIKLGE